MPAKKSTSKQSKAKVTNGVEPDFLHMLAQLTSIVKGHKGQLENIEKSLKRVLDRMGL